MILSTWQMKRLSTKIIRTHQIRPPKITIPMLISIYNSNLKRLVKPTILQVMKQNRLGLLITISCRKRSKIMESWYRTILRQKRAKFCNQSTNLTDWLTCANSGLPRENSKSMSRKTISKTALKMGLLAVIHAWLKTSSHTKTSTTSCKCRKVLEPQPQQTNWTSSLRTRNSKGSYWRVMAPSRRPSRMNSPEITPKRPLQLANIQNSAWIRNFCAINFCSRKVLDMRRSKDSEMAKEGKELWRPETTLHAN